MSRRCWVPWGVAAAILATALPLGAKPADLTISGMGIVRDHTLRSTLIVLLGKQRGDTLNAAAIEDASLILFSTLTQAGYLEPTMEVKVTAADGNTASYPLDANLNQPLPRDLAATAVTFEIRKGHRFRVTTVEFRGLVALRPDQARSYFRGDGILAEFTSERAYSPDRLNRSLSNLRDELRHRGYADAVVTAQTPKVDHATGAVKLLIDVKQGPQWYTAELALHVSGPGPTPVDIEKKNLGKPWSAWWGRDAETDLRRWYYQRGYPDVLLSLVPDAAPAADPSGSRRVIVRVEVRTGSLIHLGEIHFQGNTRTREAVLRPLIKIKPGDPLNPLQLQDGQYKISRLGVFSAVDLQYQPAQGPVRDAVYELKEGKKSDVDLLLGWGSYEELRGGVEWREYDLWGRAHEGTLKFVQSLKSTEGEYDYTVPELFGTETDGTAKAFGFQRYERSFVDQQYGTTISITTPLHSLGTELLTGYTFERLRAENDTLATVLTDSTNANATSLEVGLTRDRRDNPLEPHSGYKIAILVEEASRLLGGQVDFQQYQIAASYHTPWGRSRWIHIGLSHEDITTFGSRADNPPPPNVYFYPGGEDSIRGYGIGEAAPRGPDGKFVPAVSYTLLNVELEQALTSKWSAVVFSDSLGGTDTIEKYPFDYELYSVGVGLRYRTIIGPIRLEYGRNLNPRPHDPPGTALFSVGFPF
jgi:outer membrane protein assembly complex protein YaeT